MGLLGFVFVLLMFQALRYTEFVLIHGVGLGVMGRLVGFMALSFLPALFPMSLLFAVLSTYTRLSQDSELLALKASGYHFFWIVLPAALFGGVLTLASLQTTFQLAPWANRQFELLIHDLGNSKAATSIREGTFSEGFFNLVIYANKVNTKTGEMSRVFIYDERDEESPLAIVAKQGQLIQKVTSEGPQAELRLFQGEIHRKGLSQSRVVFQQSVFRLSDRVEKNYKAKSAPSLTWDELMEKLDSTDRPEEKALVQTELHKRLAIALACLIFCLLAVGVGAHTNKRAQKSGVVVICSVVILAYWILYVTFEGMARNGDINPVLAMWIPNFIFCAVAVRYLYLQVREAA